MTAHPQENALLPIQYLVVDDDGVTPRDISSATGLKLVCTKPSGTTVEFTADFVTDGSDGLIQYSTVDGDLVPAGVWRCQARFSMPNAAKTEVVTFRVLPNL